MKVLVFGSGAVGSYLGGRLAHAGHHVTLIARPTAATLIREDGLLLTENGQRLTVHPNVVTSLRQAFLDDDQYDVMLMCMKSYDVEAAINELVAFCPAPPLIITMQNGLGIEERLASEFGDEHIIAGSITVPLSLSASNSVIVEAADRGIALAPFVRKQNIKPWVDLFRQANIETAKVKEYKSLKWSKALLNILGNSTSAIINRHPSAIYKYAPTFNLELDMFEEALAIAKASKIKIVNLPGPKISQLIRAIGLLPRALMQPVLVRLVANGRGEKMPSFQIDLASGKGKNEVFFHNVAISEQAKAVNVDAPINRALGAILMGITEKKVDWQRYNGKPDQLVADVERYRR